MAELVQKEKVQESKVFPKPGSKLATLSDIYRLYTLRNKLLEDFQLKGDPNINGIMKTQLFFAVKSAAEHFIVDNIIHKYPLGSAELQFERSIYAEFQDYDNNRIWFEREEKGIIKMQAEINVLKWGGAIT